MAILNKHLHKGLEIQGLDRVIRPPILEIIPSMRSRQIDRLAGPIGEVMGICRKSFERSRDRLWHGGGINRWRAACWAGHPGSEKRGGECNAHPVPNCHSMLLSLSRAARVRGIAVLAMPT